MLTEREVAALLREASLDTEGVESVLGLLAGGTGQLAGRGQVTLVTVLLFYCSNWAGRGGAPLVPVAQPLQLQHLLQRGAAGPGGGGEEGGRGAAGQCGAEERGGGGTAARQGGLQQLQPGAGGRRGGKQSVVYHQGNVLNINTNI